MFSSSRIRGGTVALVLLASTLFVFHPIVFSGYTLGQNRYTVDMSRRYVDEQLPFLDPAATEYQDEPWLFFLRKNLSQGRLPLVNLQNALGAPLLESLQPGVLYLLNPLLVLLPGTSTRLLDWFSLLHVGILVTGLFMLLRLYARREVALSVALLMGLSGATYHHINMVHYRGFVWLPWMLHAGIRLARGERSRSAFACLAFATLASATAGNLQDFVMSSVTFTVVCAGEALLSSPVDRWKRLAWVFGFFGLLGLAAAPAFLPYLVSLRDGNLASVGAGARCLWGIPGIAFSPWLLPAANGRLWDQLLVEGLGTYDQQLDIPTVATFFILAGFGVLLRYRQEVPRARRGMMWLLTAFLVVWVAKLMHLPVFDFCASLPIVQGIRFPKYVLHLAVVIALLVTLSLESLLSLPFERRRALVRFSALATLLLVGAMLVAHRMEWLWRAPAGSGTRRALQLTWGVSVVLVVAAAVLLHQRRRVAWGLLVLAILAQAVLVRPNGYSGYPRQPPATAPALAQWGDSGGLRLMTTTLANSNLIWNQEEIGVFDPILNRAMSELMIRHFPVFNPGFHIQVSQVPMKLSPVQFDVLRFMGVEALEAAAFQMPGEVPVENGLSRVPDPLPKAFLLSATAAAEAEARCAANDVSGAVSVMQADLAGRGGLAVSVRTNGLRLRGSATEAWPLLVVNQAYSTSWNHEGR
ncbi:MAG: hypothetical protein ABW123_08600, partial [Cystobacter sp.]